MSLIRSQWRFRAIIRRTAVALLIVFGPAEAGDPAGALECPVPHPTATPNAIKQTEPQIREYFNLLAKQGDRIVPNIILRLKKRHPRPNDAEITNFLVTIYCPAIDRNAALSDEQKKARIVAFSSGVMKRLERP